MKRFLPVIVLAIGIALFVQTQRSGLAGPESAAPGSLTDSIAYSLDNTIGRLYDEIGLAGVLPRRAFRLGMIGQYNLKGDSLLSSDTVITIIDYTRPSTEERLFVINLDRKRLITTSLVSHGKNSGHNRTESFSNTPGSLKSSLGFYVTAETYHGVHGYSLRLTGVEPGVNDNARRRAIVIHGARYVSTDFAQRHGRLGRSWGCPALPLGQYREIIDVIKQGTCLFAYFDDESYLENSVLLNPETAKTRYLKEVIPHDDDTSDH